MTAFLDQYLKGSDFSAYLNPAVEVASEGVVSLDDDGNPPEDHTYWASFLPRTALGMRLRAETAE